MIRNGFMHKINEPGSYEIPIPRLKEFNGRVIMLGKEKLEQRRVNR